MYVRTRITHTYAHRIRPDVYVPTACLQIQRQLMQLHAKRAEHVTVALQIGRKCASACTCARIRARANARLSGLRFFFIVCLFSSIFDCTIRICFCNRVSKMIIANFILQLPKKIQFNCPNRFRTHSITRPNLNSRTLDVGKYSGPHGK